MESSIFVSAPFEGVFWHFKVDRWILLTLTVYLKHTHNMPKSYLFKKTTLGPSVTKLYSDEEFSYFKVSISNGTRLVDDALALTCEEGKYKI